MCRQFSFTCTNKTARCKNVNIISHSQNIMTLICSHRVCWDVTCPKYNKEQNRDANVSFNSDIANRKNFHTLGEIQHSGCSHEQDFLR